MSAALVLRATRWRPVSLQDRVLFVACLRNIAIVLVLLTTIAVALDTASWIERVGSAAAETGKAPALSVLRFVALRMLDNGAQTLPIAAILGFIWTEVAYHRSGHRLVDRITGRTEGRAMRSIFFAGVAVALCQTVLENLVRPLAVQTMIHERIAYWTRYTEFAPGRPVWISAGGTIVEGSVPQVGASELREVTYYAFDGTRLVLIARAETMRQQGGFDASGTPLWSLEAASLSTETMGGERSNWVTSGDGREAVVMPWAVSSGWLPLAPIRPAYLTLPELARMARMEHLPDGAPHYASWLVGRTIGGTVVGLLCIFIGLLCRSRLDGGRVEIAVMLSLGIGYGGLLALRMFRVIGEHASHGVLLNAAVPFVLCGLIILVVRHSTRHDAVGQADHRAGEPVPAA